MSKITVKDKQITVLKVNDEDYLSLTDMLKAKDGDFFITDWLRNRNTLEYTLSPPYKNKEHQLDVPCFCFSKPGKIRGFEGERREAPQASCESADDNFSHRK